MNSDLEAATAALSQLQRSLTTRDQSADEPIDESERLLFCPIGDALHVEFYGLTFGTFFERFMETLRAPAVAACVGALVFDGPDEGGNGTRDWDFSPLLQRETQFPRLQTLEVVPSTPDQHNQTVIRQYLEEDGQIARLISRMPNLEHLTVPCAPDATFFQIGSHPLQTLRVEAGFDTQDFVLNFAQSSNFGQLRALDFGDYSQTYMENYREDCTPFEHYKLLFRSPAFATIRRFTLRNSILLEQQLKYLAQIKRECSFMAIRCVGDYVQP